MNKLILATSMIGLTLMTTQAEAGSHKNLKSKPPQTAQSRWTATRYLLDSPWRAKGAGHGSPEITSRGPTLQRKSPARTGPSLQYGDFRYGNHVTIHAWGGCIMLERAKTLLALPPRPSPRRTSRDASDEMRY